MATVCLKASHGSEETWAVPAGASGDTGLCLHRLDTQTEPNPRTGGGMCWGSRRYQGGGRTIPGAQRRHGPTTVCPTSCGRACGRAWVRDAGPAGSISASTCSKNGASSRLVTLPRPYGVPHSLGAESPGRSKQGAHPDSSFPPAGFIGCYNRSTASREKQPRNKSCQEPGADPACVRNSYKPRST